MLHNNWFLTVFEKNIIPVAWISFSIAVVLTGTTYLFDPIYAAKTIISLDASITHLLPSSQEGIPATTYSDYIRPEYFAIDSVNLMQQPEIGKKVIVENALKDSKGSKIEVDAFINPSDLGLLFSTDGQGVTVKWVSDTQQFSITGYGKDIQVASTLSSQYTAALIEFDKKQYINTLKNIEKRNTIIINKTRKKDTALAKQQEELRKKYGVADWEESIGQLTTALVLIESKISDENIESFLISQKLEEYEKYLIDLKKPIHLSEIEQKNEHAATLKDTLTNLATQLAAASLEFTPMHPEYQSIQKKIDTIRQYMANETKREYFQSSKTTSTALDNVIESVIEIKINGAVRTAKLSAYNTEKERYLIKLNTLGNAYAAYEDIAIEKSRINDTLQATLQTNIQIEALYQEPFSFFRVVADPFTDLEDIDNAKHLPKRKKILMLSFFGVFFLCYCYIFLKELHIETLFNAWQLNQSQTEMFKFFDIVKHTKNQNALHTVRHIFNIQNGLERLVRVRRLDKKSDPSYIAKSAADYFVLTGESTLLINNRKEHLWKQKSAKQYKGLHSWLTGHIDQAAIEITKSDLGYNVLYDSFWDSMTPWTKPREEITTFFSDLATQYKKIILLDPSVNSSCPLAGDALALDIDILVVQGGVLSVSQTLTTIQQEKQTVDGNKTVVIVMNDDEAINLFSVTGLFRLTARFLIFPFKLLRYR